MATTLKSSLAALLVPSLLSAALGLSLGGCSGDSGPSDISMGNPDVLAGTFLVNLVAPDGSLGTAGYTSLVGKVTDGPTPSTLVWTDSSSAGGCKLRKPRVPFCETACTGGAICVDDNKCQSYPKAQSVGTVRASGFKTASGPMEFTMDPVAGSYQPGNVSLPFPAFAEGDALKLEAGGGVYAPFSLSSAGIAPLSLLSDPIPVTSGQPVKLVWNPPGKSGISTIRIKLDISHHGGTKGMIECDAADSGSFEIAASLVTELLNLGTAGFPTIVVTREATRGTAVIAPGRVELSVASAVERAVQIPGVVSCTETAQCTSGKTCQSDLTCK